MSGNREQPFLCTVVNEQVRVKLTSRRTGGFSGQNVSFVQCDQHECQYVDENKLPCPLNPEMFAQELSEPERDPCDPY